VVSILRLTSAVVVLLLLTACPDPVCTTCGTGGGGAVGGGLGFGGGSGGIGGGVGSGGGSTTGSVIVTGRVTYDFVPATYNASTQAASLGFAQSTKRPVRGVVMQVLQGTSVIGTSTTNENGVYTVGFTPAGAGALVLYALTKSLNPPISVIDNTDQLLWAVSATLSGQNQTVDLNATHGWTGRAFDLNRRAAAPFAILDSMTTAMTAFTAARPLTFPALVVNWSPNNVPESPSTAGDKARGKIGTSHFSPSENQIYVLGKDGVDTDEFDAHVIVHEWGHYFEANLSRSDSPGGRHGPGDVLDPRIAFGEAWGNSVASMVLPETTYTDTNWSQGTLTGFGFDAETAPTPTDDPVPSAFSESSVLRVLYDVYDGKNEPFDQFGVGLGPIIDVLTGPQKTTEAVTTLASFITGLKARAGVDQAGLDALLGTYDIGPVTTIWGDGDPLLRGMYTEAPLPFDDSIGLGGGNSSNSWEQNQYYVVTGTGGTISVSAAAAQDVGIAAYRLGQLVAGADSTLSGTETFSFSSLRGAKYVVILTGFGQTPGNYTVTMSIH
jgi:hypothetical protein